MAKQCWLVKQEPESYAWETFLKEGRTAWTGVRNFQARNHLRAMRRGDPVLYYHTGEAKQVVGLARVDKEPYPDPTANENGWVCVDLAPVKTLVRPVPLAVLKSDKALQAMTLLRQSRLSVTPLTEAEFLRILALAETKA
jgi:predicted RNA-binding protein with PUA-like domain